MGLPDLLKIPESNNDGSHSIDSMYLHGFSGSGRGGGHCPYFRLVGGTRAPGAPLLPPPMRYDPYSLILARGINTM